MPTSVMWTLGHMHHEQDFYWLKYEFDGKKWFPPHLVMCKTSWWKSGPNNRTWFTSCGWGLCVGLLAHNHIHTYKTKFPFNQIKRHKNNQPYNLQKWQMESVISFETIPSMSKVIFYCQLFYILLRGKIFKGIPLHCSLHIPLFTLQRLKTRTWGMYAISIATLFWSPCLNPFFHTKSALKKGDFAWFGSRWIGIMEFTPCFKLLKE